MTTIAQDIEDDDTDDYVDEHAEPAEIVEAYDIAGDR